MKPKNILTRHVLDAYEQLGGIAYLRTQPKLLQEILVRILNKPDPVPTVIVDMSQHAPWLDWRSRLAYRNTDAEPSPLGIEHRPTLIEDAKPWREGNPESGRNANVALDDLLYPKGG